MLVALDFETYYDDDYSVTKMATSEYVRDPRFEAISCAVKIGDAPTRVAFGHQDIMELLDEVDWSEATLLAHHAHFDGLILTHQFGKIPKRWACTLSMSRALHSKSMKNDLGTVAKRFGKENKLPMPPFKGKHVVDLTAAERDQIAAYNKRDTDICREIHDEMAAKFPAGELDLIDITVRMFTEPVLRVDTKLARQELVRERLEKRQAIKESGETEEVLSSSKKFAAALTALGVDVPMKPSPTVQGKLIPAFAKTDDGLQVLAVHPDPKVAALVAGRTAVKSTIGESRAERMLLRAKRGMRLPIYLNYHGAHTGRWSGGDKFNPQNFKQSQKSGGALRKAILAPRGWQLVVVDASQIEARITAWLSDEKWVLEAFRAKRDLYCEFASTAYGREITKADKEERFVGKTCVLGLGYGMGAPKLQFTVLVQSINQGLIPVRLPLEVCYRLVSVYRGKCQATVKTWRKANDRWIGAMLSGNELEHKCIKFVEEACELPNGLRLRYPGIDADVVQGKRSGMFKNAGTEEMIQNASYEANGSRSKLYGGLLVENVVQALARIVVGDVMRELAKRYRIVMMSHDEIVFLAKTKDAQNALDEATKLMAVPPVWAPDLPLSSEGGFDVCYSK